MSKKVFVSLFFSQKRIQVIALSSSRRKVEKSATIDLPTGLIENYRVKNVDGLSAVIRSVWKKLKIKERSVGIVVPEFSTFIKNFKIPKIEPNELDEAVRWQAQEFLPKPIKYMSLDWRIVKRLEEDYHVMVIALEKEVLDGYVKAVDLAGLYPLVVETPSLALVRLSDPNEKGKLLIYQYFEELILIVADEEKIIGSSVLETGDIEGLVSTIRKAINHYKDIEIRRIIIGGDQISQELISGLQKNFNIEFARLVHNISGLTPSDVQKYLVPISLQFNAPSEPLDENTVNLLPPVLLNKYDNRRIKVRIWSFLMFFTFVVWTSFFVTVGTNIFIHQQIVSFKNNNSTKLNTIVETEDARKQIAKINQVSTDVIKIVESSNLPHEIINPINNIKPEGITILNYDIDLDLGSVVLQGISATRTDLINFKKKIEENEDFAQVTLPISSFEVESNLQFQISFVYLNEDK